jgi:FixJ family two-component response regulator
MSTPAEARSIAIVDDDELMRDALQNLLKEAGFAVRTFASAEEFLESGEQHHSSCLVADISMSGMSGLELQAKLYAEQIRIPIIFVTAHGDDPVRMEASDGGAVGFLAKPFDDELFLEMVRAASKLWS